MLLQTVRFWNDVIGGTCSHVSRLGAQEDVVAHDARTACRFGITLPTQ